MTSIPVLVVIVGCLVGVASFLAAGIATKKTNDVSEIVAFCFVVVALGSIGVALLT